MDSSPSPPPIDQHPATRDVPSDEPKTPRPRVLLVRFMRGVFVLAVAFALARHACSALL
ncbi:hypothetical protein ABZT23_39405 [Streptomyces sp. NPDC005386]|uniref:hypothetical protein n=1 Tax=Streptomyces sp. NPDC005386 TaxID=3154562 RepID=UPI0033A85B8D